MGAAEALLEVLRWYLARRGEVVVPTARAAGQDRVKVAFRGLYRSLPEGLGYDRFSDIVSEVESDPRERGRLEELGVRIVEVDGEPYLEVPLGLLERLMAEGRRGRGGD